MSDCCPLLVCDSGGQFKTRTKYFVSVLIFSGSTYRMTGLYAPHTIFWIQFIDQKMFRVFMWYFILMGILLNQHIFIHLDMRIAEAIKMTLQSVSPDPGSSLFSNLLGRSLKKKKKKNYLIIFHLPPTSLTIWWIVFVY